MDWVVFEEEKINRKWIAMPEEVVGSPLYEHATDYITRLDNGERVMVSKRNGHIYENYNQVGLKPPHLISKEQIKKMRAGASRLRRGYRNPRAVLGVHHGYNFS